MMCFTENMGFPTCSWHICWHETYEKLMQGQPSSRLGWIVVAITTVAMFAAGVAMFVVSRCGSLWLHRAGHSLIHQSYAVWIPRTKLPKTNEEEEGRADFLLFGYRVQRAVVPAKSRFVFLTWTEDSPVEETSSQAR